MSFDGFNADFEIVGDGFVHLAGDHGVEYLPLAIRQRRKPCGNACDLALLGLRLGGERERFFDAFQ